jgi:predicted nucleic-acid-binding protein
MSKKNMTRSNTHALAGSVDTNILVRLVVQDSPKHTALVDALLEGGKKFLVEDVALFEMVFVLESYYERQRDIISENVRTILRCDSFVTNADLFERALDMYITHPKVSFVDCALLMYARSVPALPLISFDRSLQKAGNGNVIEP